MKITVQWVLNVILMTFVNFLVRSMINLYPVTDNIYIFISTFLFPVGGSCSGDDANNCPLGSTCDMDDTCKINGKKNQKCYDNKRFDFKVHALSL